MPAHGQHAAACSSRTPDHPCRCMCAPWRWGATLWGRRQTAAPPAASSWSARPATSWGASLARLASAAPPRPALDAAPTSSSSTSARWMRLSTRWRRCRRRWASPAAGAFGGTALPAARQVCRAGWAGYGGLLHARRAVLTARPPPPPLLRPAPPPLQAGAHRVHLRGQLAAGAVAPAAHHPAHRRLRVVHAPPAGRPGRRRRPRRARHLQRRQGLGARG
jgi:hypothetical protein